MTRSDAKASRRDIAIDIISFSASYLIMMYKLN